MRSAFVYKGSSEAFGTKTDNYIYKGLTVVVSYGDFSYERHGTVKAGEKVLHISFSSRSSSPMNQKEINDCLAHFGIDRMAAYYTFEKKSTFPPHKLIRHYEQIQHIYNPNQDALPC